MTQHTVSPVQRKNAKCMRHAMTEAELKLWNAVRAHRLEGLGFKRQVPIGRYIADFVCHEHKLIVEVDGSQHAEQHHATKDCERSTYLAAQGWHVIRFWNDEVLKDIDGVCLHILAVLREQQGRSQ